MRVQAPTDTVPVFPEAVLGYRVWRMKQGRLRPLFAEGDWHPGVNTAVCNAHLHSAPDADCRCGFNAHHNLKGALEEAEDWVYSQPLSQLEISTLVVGAIAGAGSIRIHHMGFRCQEAQILALLPIEIDHARFGISVGNSWPRVATAAEHYKVPVFPRYQDLGEYLHNLHIEPISHTLRPPEPGSTRPSLIKRMPGWYKHLVKFSVAFTGLFIAALIADAGMKNAHPLAEAMAYFLVVLVMIVFSFGMYYADAD